MTLVAADEFRHEATDEPNWQENYIFVGWDDDRQAGLYLHLGHLATRGIVDVRALVRLGGRTVSASREFEAKDCLEVPWIQADVRSPLERWRLRCAAPGVLHPGGPALVASDGTGDHEFGFDIELNSVVPPIDWGVAWAQLGIPDIMSDHYEAGARWQGTVWTGAQKSRCSGLLIRDHSWGPRNLSNAIRIAWWLPIVFDDGRSFMTGGSLLRDGRWGGFILEERGNGPRLISTDPMVRVDGLQTPGGFDSATILHTRDGGPERVYEYQVRLHVPIYYESMGANLLDEVFCRVTAADGRRGFADLQLNLPRAPATHVPTGTPS